MIEIRQFVSVLSRVVHISPWYYLFSSIIVVVAFLLFSSYERYRRLCVAFLCGYLFWIIATTVLARAPKDDARVNLQLFWTYQELFRRPRGSHGLNIEIFLNILMLAPVGVLIPIIFEKRFLFTVGIGGFISVVIELLQYITHRGLTEIDDIGIFVC